MASKYTESDGGKVQKETVIRLQEKYESERRGIKKKVTGRRWMLCCNFLPVSVSPLLFSACAIDLCCQMNELKERAARLSEPVRAAEQLCDSIGNADTHG